VPNDFDRDRLVAFAELKRRRSDLREVVKGLSDADLDRTRRGSWSVRQVIAHVVESDWWFARAVGALRELEPATRPEHEDDLRQVEQAIAGLAAARAALTEAIEGVTEDAFYRMRKIGPQEYSVLSVLENCADHDREHAQQVQRLVVDR
jgi:uncharacterized damage-inducible protein DinB